MLDMDPQTLKVETSHRTVQYSPYMRIRVILVVMVDKTIYIKTIQDLISLVNSGPMLYIHMVDFG